MLQSGLTGSFSLVYCATDSDVTGEKSPGLKLPLLAKSWTHCHCGASEHRWNGLNVCFCPQAPMNSPSTVLLTVKPMTPMIVDRSTIVLHL